MIEHYFGADFDLHSGGVDLVFPHHENEIAQSCCAAGGSFAHHWFHINHLMVDGGKMSKSLGNLYTIDDLAARGHGPMAVRYVLLSGTYRRPLNFTLHSLHDAESALARLGKFAAALQQRADQPALPYEQLTDLGAELEGSRWQPAWQALNEDLNTPAALGRVFTALRKIKPENLNSDDAAKLWRGFQALVNGALGLQLEMPATDRGESGDSALTEAPESIRELAGKRWQAKQDRDFALADQLRGELAEAGWQVKDRKDGYDLLPGD
jgi:cysteinyl-tRNA synthetase